MIFRTFTLVCFLIFASSILAARATGKKTTNKQKKQEKKSLVSGLPKDAITFVSEKDISILVEAASNAKEKFKPLFLAASEAKGKDSATLVEKATKVVEKELAKVPICTTFKNLSSITVVRPIQVKPIFESLPVGFFPPHAIYWDFCDSYQDPESRKKLLGLIGNLFFFNWPKFCGLFVFAAFLQLDLLAHFLFTEINRKPENREEIMKEVNTILRTRYFIHDKVFHSKKFSDSSSKLNINVNKIFYEIHYFSSVLYSRNIRKYFEESKEEFESLKTPELPDGPANHIFPILSQMYSPEITYDNFLSIELGSSLTLYWSRNEYLFSVKAINIMVFYLSAST
jgi:hypothetical protein